MKRGRTFGNVMRCIFVLLAWARTSVAAAGSIFDFDDTPAKPAATHPAPAVPEPPPIKPTELVTPPPAPDKAKTRGAPGDPVRVAPPAAPRDVPAKADLERSGKLLKEAFAKQLEDRSLPGRRKLAQTLLLEAAKAGESPSDQYVLISGAVNAARESASLRLLISATDELAKLFTVDPTQVKVKAVANVPLKADTPSTTIDNVLTGLELIDGFVADEQYAPAVRLCALLRTAAAGDAALTSIVQKRQTELERLAAARERIALQVEKLKSTPDDAVANLAVGSFACYYADQWPTGLAMLAKGSDADLKKLAAEDVAAAASTEANTLLKLGDAWWAVSARHATSVQGRIRRHALGLYARIDGKLSPLERIKIDNRAAEVAAADAGEANALAEVAVKQKLARIKEVSDRAAEASAGRRAYPASDDPLDGDVPLPAVDGGYALTGRVDIGYSTNNHGGGPGKSWLNGHLIVAPGACIDGGVLLVQAGTLDLAGEPANPVVLRNVHVACEFTGVVKARYAVFENCQFTKDGSYHWNDGPSAKFEIRHSLVINGDFKSFGFWDSGIKFDASSFVGCKFPDRFGRPQPNDDSLPLIRNEWNHVADCDFYNCETAACFYEMPNHCNFYHCKITDDASYRSAKELKVELGLPGDDRDKFLAELTSKLKAVGEGAMTFTTAAGGRFPTQSYPQ